MRVSSQLNVLMIFLTYAIKCYYFKEKWISYLILVEAGLVDLSLILSTGIRSLLVKCNVILFRFVEFLSIAPFTFYYSSLSIRERPALTLLGQRMIRFVMCASTFAS